MNEMRAFVVACVLALICSNAAAQNNKPTKNNIQTLRDWCKKPKGNVDLIRCTQYVTGVAEMMVVIGAAAPEARGTVTQIMNSCGAPPTASAMVQTFISWADRHPERWRQPRLYGVLESINEAWPCQSFPRYSENAESGD